MAKCKVYQRKSGQWAYDIHYDGYRIRKVVGENKKLAEMAMQAKFAEIISNGYKKEPKENFSDLVETYVKLHAQHKKSWRSGFRNSLRHLQAYFGNKRLSQITPRMVEEYKIERQKHVSEASVNRELACMKSIFNKGIDWEIVQTNPVKKIKLFKERNQRKRFLKEEEIEKLLACSPPRLQAVITIAINTGMRKGELQNLKWADINFETGFIALKNTKNGEPRDIPINGAVKEALTSLRQDLQTTEHVFVKQDGTTYNVRKSFETALRKTGITDFRFHDLRHTFASHLVMSGIDLNTVRELLGHKSIEMTLRYSHLSQTHKLQAVQALNQRLGTISSPLPTEAQPAENAVTLTA